MSNVSQNPLVGQVLKVGGSYNIDSVFPVKSYYEVKKVFIRLKSRKYFQKECTICIEEFEEEADCRLLSCFHAFHQECIDSWMLRQKKCPLCNKPFESIEDLKFDKSLFLTMLEVDYSFFLSCDHFYRRESWVKDAKLKSEQSLMTFRTTQDRPDEMDV